MIIAKEEATLKDLKKKKIRILFWEIFKIENFNELVLDGFRPGSFVQTAGMRYIPENAFLRWSGFLIAKLS